MNDPLSRFAPLLDPERMAVAFEQHLPECIAGDWQLTGCAIQHPRYKTYLSPGNRERSFLSLVYHLRGRHPSSSIVEDRILYARAYLGDRSRREFEAAQTLLRSGRQDTVIHLADLGIVAWRFPDDPAMPWLGELMDAGQVAALIPRGDRIHAAGCEELMEIEVVNYRPEIRCTARYRFLDPAALKDRFIYGKSYADGRGLMVYENLVAFRLQSQTQDAFVVPTPLGYDPDRHALWLEGLHGAPLKETWFGARNEALADSLAKALAAFHQVSVPHLQVSSPGQHLLEWHRKARKLAHAYADIEPLLKALLKNLEQGCPEPEKAGLIHGDFHIDQLALLNDGRLALFDFDELAIGDPLQDVANFASDLYTYPIASAEIDGLVERLFAAYLRANCEQADPRRFAWHLSGQLLTRAYRTHIQQKTEAKRRVAHLVTLARRP